MPANILENQLKVDRVRRMHGEANCRLHDAEILSGSLAATSDSASLISILAFEVLLKCAILISTDRYKKDHWRKHGLEGGHDYDGLWRLLPDDLQEELIAYSRVRMSGHTVFSDLKMLFRAWKDVFTKARYYYEFYEDRTWDEQRQEGEQWLARGASIDEAKVKYFPNELQCLTEALNRYIEDWLSHRLPREDGGT